MSRVSVNPAMLRWARKRVRLSREALLKSFPKYADWETGEIRPTLKQLERFSQKTRTPLGHLFLPEPPGDLPPIADFRRKSGEAPRALSPDLLDTIATMRRRQDWMQEHLLEEGAEALPFVGCVGLDDAPAAVALRIRTQLGLTEGWASKAPNWQTALRLLRDAVEASGVLVVFNGVVDNNTSRSLRVEEFRGFVLVDDYAPLIFVNNRDARSAQMFTLAHELAHLWIGEEGVFNFDQLRPAENPVETFCNQTAAEFLIPTEEFQAAWSTAGDAPEPFHLLARKFKVSPLVAARRALDLQAITPDVFLEFYRAQIRREKNLRAQDEGGGDFYASQRARIGLPFAKAVAAAAREGTLLYRQAYRLTGLQGKTFDEFMERIAQ